MRESGAVKGRTGDVASRAGTLDGILFIEYR